MSIEYTGLRFMWLFSFLLLFCVNSIRLIDPINCWLMFIASSQQYSTTNDKIQSIKKSLRLFVCVNTHVLSATNECVNRKKKSIDDKLNKVLYYREKQFDSSPFSIVVYLSLTEKKWRKKK